MENQIHPSSIIGPEVKLGKNNVIGPNCVLLGPLEISDDNWFGPGVVVGTPPQSRGFEHPRPWDQSIGGAGISIGSRNVIREFVTIQSPTIGRTVVGNDCFIMTQAHIPHDSNIGNNVTIANSTQIAGHCIIQDDVTLGLSLVIHQFRVIGKGAMVGMGSVVTKHVAPYAMQYGSPAKTHGCNRIGMQRQGYSTEAVDCIEQILHQGLPATYSELEKQLLPELRSVYQNWYDLVESFSG